MPSMSDANLDRTKVRELVARCLEQLDDRGPAIVDELCAATPELAATVRRRLEALQRLGLAGAAAGDAKDGFPEQLGEFRLRRCIGGGGMGVVYLAEQESLHRTVALKLIRPEHLFFPNARERFRREIDAVARLRHPAVVPIHTSGEANGIPYYAMEWIDGASLEEILNSLRGRQPQELSGADLRAALQACRDARAADLQPVEDQPPAEVPGSPFAATSWIEACFRIALPVAHALAHAHRNGIVHRDLKPSNLMLTRDGRVLVVDFGLASTRGTSRLTQSGALLGSLPFVPPEVLIGGADKSDVRSDFYSLGVTLRELLTLERVFGHDGDDIEKTRAAILAGETRPMRERHPALPWDAETVCLVAMERDPARRYADAAALAADLEAVLSRHPIHARRPGLLLRVRRYAQRHAAQAVVMASLLVAALAIAGVWTWQQQRRLAEISAVNTKLEAQVIRTRGAVSRFLDETGNLALANVPGAEGLRRELVEQAVALLEELFAENPSPALRNELAKANSRLASRCQELGDPAAARRAGDRSTALFDGQGALPIVSFDDRMAAAFTRANRANLGSEWEEPDALEQLRAVERAWAALCAERPDDETRRLHGMSLSALIREPDLPIDEACEVARRLAQQEEVVPGALRDGDHEFTLARAELGLAQRLGTADRSVEAQQFFDHSIARLEALDRRFPDRLYALDVLLVARMERAQLLRVIDQGDEALAELQRARAVGERLTALFPGRAEFKARLGYTGLIEGETLLDRGEAEDAAPVLEDAAADMQAALEQAPDEPQARNYVSGVQRALASARLELGDEPGAAAACEAARVAAVRQVEREPGNAWSHSSLAETWLLAARRPALALEGLGAVAAATRAIDAAAAALRILPDIPDFAEIAREAVAVALPRLLERDAPEPRAEARALLQRLVVLGAVPSLDAAALGATPEFRPMLADARFQALLEAGE